LVNLRFIVGTIDESSARKQHHDIKGVAHGRDQNNARQQDQVPYARTGNQPRNLRPEWRAINFKVLKESVCFPKIQHFF